MDIKKLAIESLLIGKMEEKFEKIQQNRQLVMNINSIDDFKYHRNKIIQNMFDIEDDLRESYQQVKSTLNQNKDLIFQIEQEEYNSKGLKEKIYNYEQLIEELREDYNAMIKQLQLMKEKINSDDEYIKELENKVYSPKGSTSIVELNQKIGSENFNEIDCNKEDYNVKNLNFNYEQHISNNLINRNFPAQMTGISNNNQNANTFTNNNLAGILIERENNKKMLDDYVNDLLNSKKIVEGNINNNERTNIKENKCEDSNYIIEENKSNKINSQSSPSRLAMYTKLKANRVMEILKKLNSYEDINSIINKIFGEDILNELMSSNVEESLLDRVEDTIIEIEKLRKKDMQHNQNDEMENEAENDNTNQKLFSNTIPKIDNKVEVIDENEENEEERSPNFNTMNYYNQDYYNNQYDKANHSYANDILTANNLMRSKSGTRSNLQTNSSIISRSPTATLRRPSGEEYKFENSLRRYMGSRDEHKIFKNYTKPYGSFFDPSLQQGGESKLRLDQLKKNRSKSKNKNKNLINKSNSFLSSSKSSANFEKRNYDSREIYNANRPENLSNYKKYQFSN